MVRMLQCLALLQWWIVINSRILIVLNMKHGKYDSWPWCCWCKCTITITTDWETDASWWDSIRGNACRTKCWEAGSQANTYRSSREPRASSPDIFGRVCWKCTAVHFLHPEQWWSIHSCIKCEEVCKRRRSTLEVDHWPGICPRCYNNTERSYFPSFFRGIQKFL